MHWKLLSAKRYILFPPSAIRYVDLGSADLLAANADGAENVLRVKAALRDFSRESNLAVITEDDAYYTFNVKYVDEPVKLSVEMTDFIHDGEAVSRPNNAMEIYMRELGSESPLPVKLIMKFIYKNNNREIKNIGSKRFVRIDRVETFDKVEGILFLATPDILSGLTTWAYFDNNSEDVVTSMFGSGCSAVVTNAVIENGREGKRTLIGLFDPSVRPHVEANILSFVIPISRFKEMYYTMRESSLFDTHAWNKIRERINEA